ncbi:MAG: hypothetical protein V2I76_09045, partial [Roseobacter sp.]|nr:hypothetical protein [Roseobacter sp.]
MFIKLFLILSLLVSGPAFAQQQGPREWISGVEKIPLYRQTDAENSDLYVSSAWANLVVGSLPRKNETCLAVVYAMLEHGRGNFDHRIGDEGTWSDELGAFDKFAVQKARDLPPSLATIQTEIRADRPVILQGFSRQLGTNHFMLAVGLTPDQEVIAYDPLTGSEILIPSETMVAEITQADGTVLAFTVMTLRTLDYSLTPENLPQDPENAPDALRLDDPNIAFGEAARMYTAATLLANGERELALTEVRRLLERIAADYPESVIGRRINSAEPLGVIERDVVFADEATLNAVDGPDTLPSGVETAVAAPDGSAAPDVSTTPEAARIDIEPGLYSIDPALCAVADTIGDAWGTLFQAVVANSVQRGAERECEIVTVNQEDDMISVSAECFVEGETESESWQWRKTSQTSFDEAEGRHAGK